MYYLNQKSQTCVVFCQECRLSGGQKIYAPQYHQKLIIISNPQIDTAVHGAACLAKRELLCNHSSVVGPCQNSGMLVDVVTRSNNKAPYYERLRGAHHCIQLRFDKIGSLFGTSSTHNTNDQPMKGDSVQSTSGSLPQKPRLCFYPT